jgi:hypothetical protein
MATGTAGGAAREYHTYQTHTLRKDFTFADDGLELNFPAKVPSGSIIINAGVIVSTAFNAGSTNVLDIGTTADPDGLATDLALGTIGNIVWDELATSNDLYVTSDTQYSITVDLTGSAATAGVGHAYIEYIPDRDG